MSRIISAAMYVLRMVNCHQGQCKGEVSQSCCVAFNRHKNQKLHAVILLDWSGVDLTPKSTPYAEEAVELQDSNMAPDQIYTINSKS